MSFTVNLCHNSSPVEKIGKSLDAGTDITGCVLKEATSILRPVIRIITSDDITTYNYIYIAQFQRYYFIDDIVSINNNKWEISGHVDVLETFKNGILGQQAVVKRQQNKFNTYLNDPEWKVYADENVVAYKLSTTGFSKTLKYVLAVAGS